MLYYKGVQSCRDNACGNQTRQLLIDTRCNVPTCKSKMAPDVSETQVNDTLRYLDSLFNVEQYEHEIKAMK